MTWLRWLLFLLGTLPPAMKLASMTGVGWTKAWGIMMLASWVVNEHLIILATFNQSFYCLRYWTSLLAWLRTDNPAVKFLATQAKSRSFGRRKIEACIDYACSDVEYCVQNPWGTSESC
jgi:hypothetical protein